MSEPQTPGPVLALVADLLFAARIRAAARAAGVEAIVVHNATELLVRARAAKPRLVLVDMGVRSGDPAAAVAGLRAEAAPR